MYKLKEKFSIMESTPDKNGGDLLLRVASGNVSLKEVAKTGKGISYKVEVKTEDKRIHDKGGYIFDNGTNPLVKILKQAEENNHQVLLRFEQTRKADVDKNIPMKELRVDMQTAKQNTNISLVGVYNFNKKEWLLEKNACSSVENDSEDIITLIDTILCVDMDESEVDDFFNSSKKNESVQAKRAPFNTPVSETQNHLFTFYYFVKELEKKYEFSLNDNDKVRKKIALQLLKLSDNIQRAIKKIDYFDHKDYSHTRARYLIFSYEQHTENLNSTNLTNFKEWCERCYKASLDLIDWSFEKATEYNSQIE